MIRGPGSRVLQSSEDSEAVLSHMPESSHPDKLAEHRLDFRAVSFPNFSIPPAAERS